MFENTLSVNPLIGHIHSATPAPPRPVATMSSEHEPADASSSTESAQTSEEGTLSQAEQKRLRELKERDREVRAHEQAHLAAAGSLAKGGVSYTFERGPDQQMYAVGGEVQIDTSGVDGDPAATLRKAQIIRRAALAPNNPSSQDRSVAAEASQMASEAAAELAQSRGEDEGLNGTSSTPDPVSENAAEATASEQNAAAEEASTSCPACGGAHASAAHEGMTAYAAMLAPTPDNAASNMSAQA